MTTRGWSQRSTQVTRVVVSNGFGRFPLATIAVEAYRRGLLRAFITGAYPKRVPERNLKSSLRGKVLRKYRGFLDRRAPIPPQLIYDLWLPEIVHEVARLDKLRQSSHRVPQFLAAASHELYGRSARRVLARLGSEYAIYHYRSGFGGRSVRVAKESGAIALCDHSIAHPSVLEYLVKHGGVLPGGAISTITNPMWRGVLRDIESADHVLVNSDFVRTTFVHQGFPDERLHVIYWGVDDAFLNVARGYPERQPRSGPLRLLFAGNVERRKGAHILLESLQRIDNVDWHLDIIGEREPFISNRYGSVLKDPRVTLHDNVPRLELAKHMHRADVFVFPSLAEGSARVVIEAMALGCVIITTPNSGSIVEEPANGIIVKAGDVGALAAAVERIAALRSQLPAIESRNRNLVLDRYRQQDFGNALQRLYEELAAGTRCQ